MTFEDRKAIINTNPATHIIAVLDRSGSMAPRVTDVIGGFNNFLKDQKTISDGSTMSLYLFDNIVDRVFHHKDLQEVEPITNKTYFARGSTALLDAVKQAILDAGDKKQVILLVSTDGEENSSRSATKQEIQNLIKAREEIGWKIVYMGADANAFGEAAAFGFSVANSAKFENNGAGYAATFALAGTMSKAFRGGSSINLNQVDEKDIDIGTYGSVDLSTVERVG